MNNPKRVVKYFSLLLLITSFNLLHSQVSPDTPAYVDSIKNQLPDLEESNQIMSLLRLGFYYAQYDSKKAHKYIDEAERISNKYKDSIGLVTVYRIRGVVYYETSQSDSLLYYYNACVDLAEEMDNDLHKAGCLNNIGNHYLTNGLYKDALTYFFEAKKIYDREQLADDIAMTLSNIGATYQGMENWDKALEYGLQGLEIKKSINDSIDICTSLINLSTIYSATGKYEKALSYLKESLDIASQIQQNQQLCDIHLGLGNLYHRMGQYSLAEKNLLLAYNYAQKIEDKSHLLDFYTNHMSNLLSMGKFKEVLKYGDLAIETAKEIGDQSEEVGIYQATSTAYYALGNTQKGNEHFKLWTNTHDSLYQAQNTAQIYELEVKYETEKKEQQLEVQSLQIGKQQAQNRTQRILWGASLLLLASFAGFWFYRNHYKKKIEFEQLKTQSQKEQFEAVVFAQEKERERIARDLHDGLGQMLSAAKMNVSAIDHSQEPELVDSSIEIIDKAVAEVRNVSHDLMPKLLAEKGLIVALEDIASRVNKNKTTQFSVRSSLNELNLSQSDQIIIYRVIQELVNNSLKHAQAEKIELQIDGQGNQTIFSLQDNGKGVTKHQLENSTGIGWKNIQTRIEFLKGQLQLKPVPRGSLFLISIPTA